MRRRRAREGEHGAEGEAGESGEPGRPPPAHKHPRVRRDTYDPFAIVLKRFKTQTAKKALIARYQHVTALAASGPCEVVGFYRGLAGPLDKCVATQQKEWETLVQDPACNANKTILANEVREGTSCTQLVLLNFLLKARIYCGPVPEELWTRVVNLRVPTLSNARNSWATKLAGLEAQVRQGNGAVPCPAMAGVYLRAFAFVCSALERHAAPPNDNGMLFDSFEAHQELAALQREPLPQQYDLEGMLATHTLFLGQEPSRVALWACPDRSSSRDRAAVVRVLRAVGDLEAGFMDNLRGLLLSVQITLRCVACLADKTHSRNVSATDHRDVFANLRLIRVIHIDLERDRLYDTFRYPASFRSMRAVPEGNPLGAEEQDPLDLSHIYLTCEVTYIPDLKQFEVTQSMRREQRERKEQERQEVECANASIVVLELTVAGYLFGSDRTFWDEVKVLFPRGRGQTASAYDPRLQL